MTERLTVDEFGALHKARYGDRPAARAAVALCRPPSPFCTCCECQGIHCMLPHPGHSHRYTLPDESSPIMSYVQREPTITRAELEARLTPDVLAEIVEADNREVWDWDLVRQAILDAAFPPSEGARE